MQSGQLKHYFAHYKRQIVPGNDGFSQTQYVFWGNFYADIQPMTVQAVLDSQREGTALTCRVVARAADISEVENTDYIKNVDTNEFFTVSKLTPINDVQSMLCGTGKVEGLTLIE